MPTEELFRAAAKLPLIEVINLCNLCDEIIDRVKQEAKDNKTDVERDGVKFKYSSYIKLKPKDINKILEQYPLSEYPDIYNVSLASGAASVITDEDLFEEQEISSVRVTM